jgi:hypothetical protein
MDFRTSTTSIFLVAQLRPATILPHTLPYSYICSWHNGLPFFGTSLVDPDVPILFYSSLE